MRRQVPFDGSGSEFADCGDNNGTGCLVIRWTFAHERRQTGFNKVDLQCIVGDFDATFWQNYDWTLDNATL